MTIHPSIMGVLNLLASAISLSLAVTLDFAPSYGGALFCFGIFLIVLHTGESW